MRNYRELYQKDRDAVHHALLFYSVDSDQPRTGDLSVPEMQDKISGCLINFGRAGRQQRHGSRVRAITNFFQDEERARKLSAAFSIINPGVAAFLAFTVLTYDVKDSRFCELNLN